MVKRMRLQAADDASLTHLIGERVDSRRWEETRTSFIFALTRRVRVARVFNQALPSHRKQITTKETNHSSARDKLE